VRGFVKDGFVWELGYWIDRDLALAGLCGQVSYVAQGRRAVQIRCFFTFYAT
jgi:hypothetical protein